MSMTRIRQAALVAFTLLALVAAAGCTGAAGQGGDDTALQADRASGAAPEGGGPRAPGAPGAPGPGGPDENARAPGSPITIPAFTQIGGQPVEKVRREIEAAIRQACTPRHDLCVTTLVEAVEDEDKRADAHACFGGTRPPTDGSDGRPVELNRGSVLRILSILPDCGDDEDESSSSSTESSETSESSSSSTDTSDTSQAPPSSDTETSETVQSDAGPPPSTS
jgi:hypothetical protein